MLTLSAVIDFLQSIPLGYVNDTVSIFVLDF